jgi:hypothetical protein
MANSRMMEHLHRRAGLTPRILRRGCIYECDASHSDHTLSFQHRVFIFDRAPHAPFAEVGYIQDLGDRIGGAHIEQSQG